MNMNLLDIASALVDDGSKTKAKKLKLPSKFGKITKLVQDSQEKMMEMAQDLLTGVGSKVRKKTKELPEDVRHVIRKHPLYVSPGAKVMEVIRSDLEIAILWQSGKQNGRLVVPLEDANDAEEFFEFEVEALEEEINREIKNRRTK
jgi:hypothetical protein